MSKKDVVYGRKVSYVTTEKNGVRETHMVFEDMGKFSTLTKGTVKNVNGKVIFTTELTDEEYNAYLAKQKAKKEELVK